MALILNLETSTKNCSVSVAKDGEIIALCEESKDQYQHAEKLHVYIQWALEGAEVSLQDLDAICVDKGPGSYTGLRIGVSAAKGLCFALNIPLLSIDSLSILAQRYQGEAEVILPMIDARRKEVYTANFNAQKIITNPIEAKILDETSYPELMEKRVAIIGDACEKAEEILHLPHSEYIPSFPSAKEMGTLAEQKFKQKDFEDVAYFEPFYLKDFMIGK